MYHLDNMNGTSCLLGLKMPHQNFKILWILYSIILVIFSPSAKKISKKERFGKSIPKRRSSKEKGYSKGKRSKKTSRNTSNGDKCWTCGKSRHKSSGGRKSIFCK